MKHETKYLEPGQRVEVKFHNRGWLKGTFLGYTTALDRKFRCLVKMDNGYACHAPGFAPECVRSS